MILDIPNNGFVELNMANSDDEEKQPTAAESETPRLT
jgi:hypothetical protein